MTGREPEFGEVLGSLLDTFGDHPPPQLDVLQIEVQPWLSRTLDLGAVQHIYRFANGFGASVIRGPYSYGGPKGLWELGVVQFADDPADDEGRWALTYDTPVTDDVLGWLTPNEVAELLVQIARLP